MNRELMRHRQTIPVLIYVVM